MVILFEKFHVNAQILLLRLPAFFFSPSWENLFNHKDNAPSDKLVILALFMLRFTFGQMFFRSQRF